MSHRPTVRRLLVFALTMTGLCLATRNRRRPPERFPRQTGPRVLILGGGWAGIYTALQLEKSLPEGRVTIINRDNFFLYTPLLPEVATSAIDTRHIVNPIRMLFRRAEFAEGEVEQIDLAGHRVITRHPSGRQHERTYDHLVIALGGVTNFFGMDEVARESITLKTLADAILLRNHIIQMLEQADIEEGELRKELANFVIIGGGLNGVEVVGNLNDFVRDALQSYPNIAPSCVRIVLAEAFERLMPEVSAGLAKFALRKLQERGVEVWLNARVTGAKRGVVHFADGRELCTRTLVWVGGVSPNPLVADLPVQHDKRGRVIVDPYLRVPEHPEVWALGDCAAVPNRKGGIYPPTAQHALREASVAGRNIAAVIHGHSLRKFNYPYRIQLAAIGHRAGVADIVGLRLSGWLPWFLWRTYYLARLPRLEKRLRVTLDWTLDLIFPRDIVQIQYAQVAAGQESRRPTFEKKREAPASEREAGEA